MDIEMREGLLPSDYYVKPSGRIDALTAIEFGQMVNNAIDDYDVKNLTIDFSEVPYISSMALRILLELQRRMNDLGKMTVTNVCQDVVDVFKMTGFDKIITYKM